ncbi:PREDICTED: uncharacterized protein LOC108576967 [Habropoda laboriosa]|uniref:uncharacterized protein LOC108576967 n=1 Tax=Habropoda laboriosa TaxID=597456 RepID=UPI00083E23A2|nr:PREDICTED: uncharacterized protein LOC108576967 [Habropoda laboriosa]
MVLQTPYLDAIQAVPGATLSEKFRWLAGFIKQRISECNSLEDVVESEKIPRHLAPLVQVQAAMMMNKKNRADQSTYGAIAEALKSKDEIVVTKALQARSFFDGSNKAITNVQYFFENLFPYVSLNTRTRIIKNLSIHLAPKNSDLAKEFFVAVASCYGIEQALPLLLACNETFAYDTVVKRRIILSRKLVKQIFRKNPDFVVRYLRLSKPNTDPYVRNLHKVDIYDYRDFLAALVKKRTDSFVELYEMHKKQPPSMTLSSKCAEAFLKNGREHLQRNPKLYIKILPLKLISSSRMESIFVKLFPKDAKSFDTNEMLNYLKYYPQDKKVDFFLKSYQEVYGTSILDDKNKITLNLMGILPVEERVRQARIKLESSPDLFVGLDYHLCWYCYLPIEESMPRLKDDMAKTTEMEYRSVIACKMIFTCKVNNDDQALLEVLTYFKNRHKNEQIWFLMKVFETLLKHYDLPQLGREYWEILTEMIVRAHVKQDLYGNSNGLRMVENAIHHNILQNQPIDRMIDILVDINSRRSTNYWNILVEHPKYERLCLESCLNVVSQKYKSDKSPWKEDRMGILYDLCSSIYYFNDIHVSKTSRVERMSIKNYPWLIHAVGEIASSTEPKNAHIVGKLQQLLKIHESDLYERFWFTEKKIANVETGEALKLLRRNPEDILSHWTEYLKACQDTWSRGHTKRFVKATRWYNDLPMKFVGQCLQDLTQKKNARSVDILAMLLHGETFTKIIEPLIPNDKTIDIHNEEAQSNYDLILSIIYGMKVANPPVPLTLIGKLCEGDYLSVALAALINVCRRTNVMDVVVFARTLANQRVSVRKHGIRLMHMVAARDQLYNFLHTQWKSEQNHSIREILFKMVIQLFKNDPVPTTWSLIVQVISSLTLKDEVSFTGVSSMVNVVPDEYVVEFEKLVLSTIDKFQAEGISQWRCVIHTRTMLSNIDAAVCNLLPDDFIKELITRFLFHQEIEVSRSASVFVITGLLLPTRDNFDERMKIFSSAFTEAVKTGWNVPHPQRPRFYPVNHTVHEFMSQVVRTVSSSLSEAELPLIDGMLSTFLSLLSPQMDAMSYLLLVYTREMLFSKTPKEFGTRIGGKLPELVNIFSSLFIFYMADNLRYILSLNTFKDYTKNDVFLSVTEGLMEVETIEAALIGVQMLRLCISKDNAEKYDKLVTTFSKHDHPVIKSIVCDIINRAKFND